ncbi:MAG TPA: alpha/beta fold hydrolase [Acidimicrobiia bacterium]
MTPGGHGLDDHLEVSGLTLATHLARPASAGALPAVILCHDFPTPPRGSLASGLTFPELADRVARSGWLAYTFNFRGTGGSEGDFSINGWLDDQRAVVELLAARDDVSGIWIVGTGVGGTLAIVTAARDRRVQGVAALGGQASLDDWARDSNRFLEHCRRMDVIRSTGFPRDAQAWAREIRQLDAVGAAGRLAPRPFLLLHGSDDELVPVSDARKLADAHGDAELHVVPTAGRRLRHDPRAIATLLGWLDRQVS